VTEQPEVEFTGPGDSPKLFGRIATHYDMMNRLMSLGLDRHWRDIAARALGTARNGSVLDVGIGTGDMAAAVIDSKPTATVVGVDPTARMMQVGRTKPKAEPVRWAQADGLRLPFPDRSFDAAVSAFVLRNVVDVSLALAEQRRVVRCGGRIVCLEICWPRTPIAGRVLRSYFGDLMPRVAGLLSGRPAAYGYLPRSVRRFMSPQELARAMERVGLDRVRCERLALGTVTLHVGERIRE
jgi:demethylmenaquinone methyltransferase/2-methoxy-6-polyprenyl-1,4-benzoquinol methylase